MHLSPAWRRAWVRRKGSHGRQGHAPRFQGDTATSPVSGATSAADLPDYAPVARLALGPALNDQGYYVGRVERNLYWVNDSVYQSAFLTIRDGVVLFDAPPSIGHNHFPSHDTLMLMDAVNAGWVPTCNFNLSEDVPGYIQAPRPPRCPTRGPTSSAGTSAGSPPVMTSRCTSSTSPTSRPARGRRWHRRPGALLHALRAELLGPPRTGSNARKRWPI